MANYKVSGIVTEPDNVTPWRGFYYIGLYSDTGIAIDDDGSWRAGENRLKIDPSTGYAEITLPETGEDERYVLRFESFRGETKGPWLFTLDEDKTWGDIITLPAPLPNPLNLLDAAMADYLADVTSETYAKAKQMMVGLRTLHVDPDNAAAAFNIFPTLAAVFAAAESGDTVKFAPTVHDAGSSNNLFSGMTNLTIDMRGATINWRHNRYAMQFTDCDGIRIVGGRLRGEGTSRVSGNGIDVRDSTDVFIQDVDIDSPSESGIFIQNCDRVTLVNNKTSNCWANGIIVYSSKNLVIMGNESTDDDDAAVEVTGAQVLGASAWCENVIVAGNVSRRSKGSAFLAAGVHGGLYVNNVVQETKANGIAVLFDGTFGSFGNEDLIVANNTIIDANTYEDVAALPAIVVNSGNATYPNKNIQVIGNTIQGSNTRAIQISGTGTLGGIRVAGNMIDTTLTAAVGILVSNGADPVVENNYVANVGSVGIYIDSAVTGVARVNNNTVVDPARVSAGQNGITILCPQAHVSGNIGRLTSGSSIYSIDMLNVTDLVAYGNVPDPASPIRYPANPENRKNVAQRTRTGHTAAPTAGTWVKGAVVDNVNGVAGDPTGWVCTVAGTPGTWVPTGYINDTAGLLTQLGISQKVSRTDVSAIRSGVGAAIGDSITIDPLGWWRYSAELSLGKIRVDNVFATAGYTIAQILSTHLPQVLALADKPGFCAVQAGTNDALTTGALPSAQNRTDYLAITTGLVNAGIIPWINTIPPHGDASLAVAVNANRSRWNTAWNAWLRQLAAENGWPLLDTHEALTLITDGGYKATLSLDGLHPSALGQLESGRKAALDTDFMKLIPNARPHLAHGPNDAADMFLGTGLFLTDSNADGIANGLTSGLVANTTASVVTGTGTEIGNKQRLTRASAGTGTGMLFAYIYPGPTVSAVTATAATDLFGKTAHGFVDGTEIIIAGGAPSGFAAGTAYFVRDATANTFKLAATNGGAAMDITADGSGFQFHATTYWRLGDRIRLSGLIEQSSLGATARLDINCLGSPGKTITARPNGMKGIFKGLATVSDTIPSNCYALTVRMYITDTASAAFDADFSQITVTNETKLELA